MPRRDSAGKKPGSASKTPGKTTSTVERRSTRASIGSPAAATTPRGKSTPADTKSPKSHGVKARSTSASPARSSRGTTPAKKATPSKSPAVKKATPSKAAPLKAAPSKAVPSKTKPTKATSSKAASKVSPKPKRATPSKKAASPKKAVAQKAAKRKSSPKKSPVTAKKAPTPKKKASSPRKASPKKSSGASGLPKEDEESTGENAEEKQDGEEEGEEEEKTDGSGSPGGMRGKQDSASPSSAETKPGSKRKSPDDDNSDVKSPRGKRVRLSGEGDIDGNVDNSTETRNEEEMEVDTKTDDESVTKDTAVTVTAVDKQVTEDDLAAECGYVVIESKDVPAASSDEVKASIPPEKPAEEESSNEESLDGQLTMDNEVGSLPLSSGVTASSLPLSSGVTASSLPLSSGVKASSLPLSSGPTASSLPLSGGTASTLSLSGSGGTASTLPLSGGTASTLPLSGGMASTLPLSGGTARTSPLSGGTASTLPLSGGMASTSPPSSGVKGSSLPLSSGMTASSLPLSGVKASSLPLSSGGMASSLPLSSGGMAGPLSFSGMTASPPKLPNSPSVTSTNSSNVVREGVSPEGFSPSDIMSNGQVKGGNTTSPAAGGGSNISPRGINSGASGVGGFLGAGQSKVEVKDGVGAGDELLARRWIIKSVEGSAAGKSFDIVSYNILADVHASRDFAEAPWLIPGHWAMTHRHGRLMKELEYLNPDIICLQEVGNDYFNTLKAAMRGKGYDGVHFPRQHNFGEGEATFYKTSSFSMESYRGIPLQRLLEAEIEASGLEPELKAGVKEAVSTEAVALLVRLKFTHGLTPGSPGAPFSSQYLSVANIHCAWDNLARHDKTCLQVALTMRELIKIAGGVDKPHIICGDLNAWPGSAPYQLMQDGHLTDTSLTALQAIGAVKQTDGQMDPLVNYWSTGFQYSPASHMASAYHSVTGSDPCTSRFNTDGAVRAVDYIWYPKTLIDCSGVLQTVPKERIESGVPNEVFPSDHLSLKARLIIK